MIIHPIMTVDTMPGAGALLGSTGTAAVLNAINAGATGASFFGSANDPFRNITNSFIQNFVVPAQNMAHQLASTAFSMTRANEIVSINSITELNQITPAMYYPILMMPEMRQLLEQGRIQGWGISIDHVPAYDSYGNVINSNLIDGSDPNCDWTFRERISLCEDPFMLNLDERRYLRQARDVVRRALEETDLDPTNPMVTRG